MLHVVGPKGQVVISKEIRERLGVKPGWQALQRLVDDHVEIYFVPPSHNESLAGCLASYLKRRPAEDDEEGWDEAVSQAVAREFAEASRATEESG